ncbi:MAG: hypothetical protein LBU43_12540 [Candidatus Accumulibacter sp.]|jgi:hypothetical protein|nr:hypothetical protein [Accumulibacter sp.]
MNTSLPKITQIPDFQTGSELIDGVPLADPIAATNEINLILDSLLAATLEHQVYFELLERLCLPITFVTEKLTKCYLNKPVPLDEEEDAFFQRVELLWIKMAQAYTRCVELGMPEFEDSSRLEHLAILLYRCIHFTGMAIIEHYRARREVPWGLWLDLHSHYRTAEEKRVDKLPLPNILEEHTEQTHCAAAYLAFVLCEMAGSYSLSLRDQKLVRRWAIDWAPTIGLHAVAAGQPLPAFVIDLLQDVALRSSQECMRIDQIRRLDTTLLADHIVQIRQKLRQRIPPSQIGLGEDCTRHQCASLLSLLSRQWSQARAARKFRRHATSGLVRISTGFEEMYYFISGKEFRQPEHPRLSPGSSFDDVFALRFQGTQQQTPQFQQEKLAASYKADVWEMVDQSANGFRLIRHVDGRRIAHGQLLALSPQDNARYLLAQVTWLMQASNGGLIAGLRVLPGLPQAISARSSAASEIGPKKQYQRAFLLPALPTAEAEESLVLPSGWFRPELVIDIYTDSAKCAKLKKVLESGPDFERVSFDLE